MRARQSKSRVRRDSKRTRRRFSQTRALQVLKEVAEALNSAPTEQRAAEEALKRVADLLGVETGWVWLRDPASDRFYNAAVQSLPPYLQEPVRMTGRSCWCLELFRSGQLTARNIDVVECSRLAPAVQAQQAAETRGLRCHASVPLSAGDHPLGVMNLALRATASCMRAKAWRINGWARQAACASSRPSSPAPTNRTAVTINYCARSWMTPRSPKPMRCSRRGVIGRTSLATRC